MATLKEEIAVELAKALAADGVALRDLVREGKYAAAGAIAARMRIAATDLEARLLCDLAPKDNLTNS